MPCDLCLVDAELTIYVLLRNLVSPARSGIKTYAKLVEALNDHLIIIALPLQRQYNARSLISSVRKPGKSVSNFVAELAKFCNLGASLNDVMGGQNHL